LTSFEIKTKIITKKRVCERLMKDTTKQRETKTQERVTVKRIERDIAMKGGTINSHPSSSSFFV